MNPFAGYCTTVHDGCNPDQERMTLAESKRLHVQYYRLRTPAAIIPAVCIAVPITAPVAVAWHQRAIPVTTSVVVPTLGHSAGGRRFGTPGHGGTVADIRAVHTVVRTHQRSVCARTLAATRRSGRLYATTTPRPALSAHDCGKTHCQNARHNSYLYRTHLFVSIFCLFIGPFQPSPVKTDEHGQTLRNNCLGAPFIMGRPRN